MAETERIEVPYGYDKDGNPTGPLPAQEDFHYCPAKNRLYSGAFRAGKTRAGSHEAIKLSVDYPGNVGLICRETYPELERTTMKTFFEVLNVYEETLNGTLGDPQYNSNGITGFRAQKMTYHFNNGSMIYFAHTDNVSQFKSMEIGWFWLDEGTELIEDVYKMLISRLSLSTIPADALKCFITTNPDTFGNWVYKWFYEKGLSNYSVIETTSYDNPYLPEGYVDSLEDAYDDDLQARYLKGMWGNLEGMVYKSFNPMFHVQDIPHTGRLTKYRSIDHGYTNPFVCLWGAIDGDGRYFITDEIYERKQLVSDLAVQIKNKHTGDYINFADPSEAEGNATLRKAGIIPSQTKNDVIQGIQAVQKLLKVRGDGKPGLIIHPRCKNLIKEFQLYKWRVSDGKVNDKEEPMKLNDHACFIAGTLIHTDKGQIPIEDIKTGDNVLTRKGYRKVIDSAKTATNTNVSTIVFSNGKSLTATHNHPIYIKGKGFIPLDTISYGDITLCVQQQLNLMELHSDDIQIHLIGRRDYIIGRMQVILKTGLDIFIKRNGKQKTEIYHPDIIYTTKTAIHLIIKYLTWGVSRAANTYLPILKNIMKTIKNAVSDTWTILDHLRQNGMDLKPGAGGIVSTGNKHGLDAISCPKNALCVENNSLQKTGKQPLGFVQTTVNHNIDVTKGLIMCNENALSVEKNSQSTNIIKAKHAVENVRALSKAEQSQKHDVYNITVAEEHEYFANGILVSNCDALRYFIYSTQSHGAEISIPLPTPRKVPGYGTLSGGIPGL